MKITHKERKQGIGGYCRLILLAGLGLGIIGMVALPGFAQTNSGAQDYQVYPYYEGGFTPRRETLVFPSPEEREMYGIYGYRGSEPRQPLILERDRRDLGLRQGRFADPMADPRISPGTDQHFGYLHGYDYRYDPGVGAQPGASTQFRFNDGVAGVPRRIGTGGGQDFRATYGREAYGDGAGFYGYRGDPQIYGYQEPYRGLDTYGYYQGDQLSPQDYRPLTTPQAYDPPSYYLSPTDDAGDRAAFNARWPQHLRAQQDPTPRLMPHEQQAMREQDMARLEQFQQRPPTAYRQRPGWEEVDNYAHQWSDPMVRRQREFAARDRQMTGEVYGFDDPAANDPRSQDERWRDEERMRVIRERELRGQMLRDQQMMNERQLQQSGTYGYADRPPTAAGGRADDRRYWGRGDTRYWGQPEGRYWDYEGRRWWVDRNGRTDQSFDQGTPDQRQPMTGDLRNGTGTGASGGTDTGGTTGGANGGTSGGVTGGATGGGQ